MSIDKALYAAPMGLEQLLGQGEMPDIEIEMDLDPEEMGDMDIDLAGEDVKPGDAFDDNLAELLPEEVLQTIASDIISDFDDDVNSRKEWVKTYVDGIELLGMSMEERTEPWEGACGVYHPLLAESVVKFQSETMMSTFPAAGPVKTKVIGKETPEKKAAAERVADDMNHQLTDVMKEYRSEHERMLWGLGMSGNAFKKVYYDAHMQRQVSIFCPSEDVIVPYGASNLETAERVTHVMRKTKNDLRRLMVAGFYRDIDLGEPNNILDEIDKKIAEKMGFRASSDDRFKLLEMQVDLVLPGFEHTDEDGESTGVGLPYVVTVEKGSQQVLSIRRNWHPDDETYTKRSHFVHYPYIPGFGFYAFGMVHLIGAFAKAGTSILRQLVDAGSLANLPGGLKARGLRVKGDDTPIAPGEFRDVDIPGGTIKDNIMLLPYKEPSQTLATLLQSIIDDGRRFANTADLQISDMSGDGPVGTTLAILERTLKVMSAVQARVHYAMKQELVLLKEIIAEYTPEDYDYDPIEGPRKAKKSDYDNVDVIPVSDPNAATMAQKITQYQAVLQLAQQAPQLYNLPLLHRQMLDVLGITNANKLIPMEEDQKPTDPVTENQNALMLRPLKAFQYQDHKSHIAVHMSAMQDPKIQQLMQNNPQSQQVQAALQSHIAEHLGFEYRVQIEQQLGMTLPPQKDASGEDQHMDPQVEARLSPLLAQAAQQLLQGNQKQAQQQQAQQQQQDPLVQLQQQEMQLKQQELQLKQQAQQFQQQMEQQKLQLEAQKINNQKDIAQGQQHITAAANVAKLEQDRKEHELDSRLEALKHVSTLHERRQERKVDILQSLTEGHRQDIQHKEDMIHEGIQHMVTQSKPVPQPMQPKKPEPKKDK